MTVDTASPLEQNIEGNSLGKNSIPDDMKGYNTSVYPNKQAQMEKVCAQLASIGFIPADFVKSEVNWFYNNLGIDDEYFHLESVDTICNHILAIYGAKIAAFSQKKSELDINLVKETEESSIYIYSSEPGVSQLDGPHYENIIDKKYLDNSCGDNAYRLESYRSNGVVSSENSLQLRSYFVTKCHFVNPHPTPEQETDIKKTADKQFLVKATKETCQTYEKVMLDALKRSGPVIEVYKIPDTREHRLIIGYRQQSTQKFFSGMSDLYHFYDLYSTRKYIEQFSNGVTIMSIYLKRMPDSKSLSLEHAIYQVMKEISLIYCLPSTAFLDFFKTNKLSVQETVYAFVAWIFAQHFFNRLGKEYLSLSEIMDTDDSTQKEVLLSMKKRLREDTFTPDDILNTLMAYPELLQLLYINFASTHYINKQEMALSPTISYQRMTARRYVCGRPTQENLQYYIQLS